MHANMCSPETMRPGLIESFVQVITPWDVTGGIDGKIDYGRLIREVR